MSPSELARNATDPVIFSESIKGGEHIAAHLQRGLSSLEREVRLTLPCVVFHRDRGDMRSVGRCVARSWRHIARIADRGAATSRRRLGQC